jgi:hypothetical protein
MTTAEAEANLREASDRLGKELFGEVFSNPLLAVGAALAAGVVFGSSGAARGFISGLVRKTLDSKALVDALLACFCSGHDDKRP